MKTLQIIASLNATNSRIEKEQIIFAAFMEGERDLFVGAKLAYDKLISFGVAKVAEIQEADDGQPGSLSFDDFLTLAHKLRKRELTGHAARDAIHAAAAASGIAIWNEFYRRILLKDLRIGAETSTFNKVLGKIGKSTPEALEYLIPVFSPQLAKDGADDNGVFLPKYNKGKKLLDTKFDGARLLSVLDIERMSVTQYTREGRINENFPHLAAAFEKLLPFLPGSVMIDGEITAGSFQELMSQLNSTEKASNTTKLAMFDIVPLADFQKGLCPITQRDRHAALVALGTSDKFNELVGEHAYVLPKIEVDLDTEAGQQALAEFLAQTAEVMPNNPIIEGVMVKDPEAPYINDRSEAWLKIKPVISVSLTCVGVEPGKPDGKNANTLGGLVCEGVEDGKQIRVVCGGGISDLQRNEWWADPSKVIGFIVEIEGDKLSKPKKGDVWSVRFPRLKGLRGTQPGEKM